MDTWALRTCLHMSNLNPSPPEKEKTDVYSGRRRTFKKKQMFGLLFSCVVVTTPAFFLSGARYSARKTVTMGEFHGEGDNTGDYMLSGLWRLTRRPLPEQRRTKTVRRPSWSGNGWSSPTRVRVPEVLTTLVSLSRGGTFQSPPDTDEFLAVRGSWSCDGKDITMARFGRGSQVIEWYSGTLRANESASEIFSAEEANVDGHILHGAHDPEFAGTFSMAPVMPQLNPVKKRVVAPRGPVFTTDHLVGTKWSLQFTSSSTMSVFVIQLRPDLTWTTVGGLGNSSQLAGKWNVFDDKIDLGSGICGKGDRLWIWLRRFGGSRGETTRGVSLNADHLYIGKIKPAPGEELSVRSVKGQVALGWNFEPAFIGSFHMKQWNGDSEHKEEDDDEVTVAAAAED